MYWGKKFYRTKSRGITPRRLAASKRFLAKDRDRYSLFAGEVAADQPTPEQRIEQHDAGHEEWWQEMRNKRANDWRKARQQLSELSPDFREATLEIWNRKRYPADPVYLLSLIRNVCNGTIDPKQEKEELERIRELGRLAREKATVAHV